MSKTESIESENNLILERASFEFSQDGNCLKGDDFTEFIRIECESDIGIDRMNDCFFVIKTDSWSIDNVEDLEKLFNRIKKVIINKNPNK